jgi:hypothetical protein
MPNKFRNQDLHQPPRRLHSPERTPALNAGTSRLRYAAISFYESSRSSTGFSDGGVPRNGSPTAFSRSVRSRDEPETQIVPLLYKGTAKDCIRRQLAELSRFRALPLELLLEVSDGVHVTQVILKSQSGVLL